MKARPVLTGLLILWFSASLASAGEFHDLLSTRSAAEQRAILAGAVESAGFPCTEATTVFYRGDIAVDNAAYFAVRCATGVDYNVRIENDGDMRSSTVECAVLAAVEVDCWKPL